MPGLSSLVAWGAVRCTIYSPDILFHTMFLITYKRVQYYIRYHIQQSAQLFNLIDSMVCHSLFGSVRYHACSSLLLSIIMPLTLV